MKRISYLLLVLIFVQCGVSEEEIMNKSAIEDLLSEFQACKDENNGSSRECKDFTAHALCAYNGITDFQKEDGSFLDYHDIWDYVNEQGRWKYLGEATDQAVLDNAQSLANRGIPVLAIDSKDKHKFCVLIIEGEQKKSGSWGLNAPNCAAFFPGHRPEPFINKTLNYAFKKPKGLEIYTKQ